MSIMKAKLSILYVISIVSLIVLMLLSFADKNLFFYTISLVVVISVYYGYTLFHLKEYTSNENLEINDFIPLKTSQDDDILDEIISITNNSVNGDFKGQIKSNSSNEKYQQIANNLNKTFENIHSTITLILNYLEKYQKNDFTVSIENKQSEELNLLIEAINKLNIKISRMLLSSLKNGVKLRENSDSLKLNINELTRNITTEAATLEETASAVEEITSIVINNNQNVEEIIRYSAELTSSVKNGYETAKNSASLMDKINEKTKSIEAAIVVIDQIAFQTNILSLNAAVEAATAGEAGKGFAVVAGEVRNLANRSAQAAKEIKDIVEKAKEITSEGKDIADEMINGYVKLNQDITSTISLIDDVQNSSKEQLQGIEQINNSISSLDKQTQQNATVANKTQEIAINTDKIAKLIVEDANNKEFIGKENIKSGA